MNAQAITDAQVTLAQAANACIRVVAAMHEQVGHLVEVAIADTGKLTEPWTRRAKSWQKDARARFRADLADWAARLVGAQLRFWSELDAGRVLAADPCLNEAAVPDEQASQTLPRSAR